jgi:hypothetical protein
MKKSMAEAELQATKDAVSVALREIDALKHAAELATKALEILESLKALKLETAAAKKEKAMAYKLKAEKEVANADDAVRTTAEAARVSQENVAAAANISANFTNLKNATTSAPVTAKATYSRVGEGYCRGPAGNTVNGRGKADLADEAACLVACDALPECIGYAWSEESGFSRRCWLHGAGQIISVDSTPIS